MIHNHGYEWVHTLFMTGPCAGSAELDSRGINLIARACKWTKTLYLRFA